MTTITFERIYTPADIDQIERLADDGCPNFGRDYVEPGPAFTFTLSRRTVVTALAVAAVLLLALGCFLLSVASTVWTLMGATVAIGYSGGALVALSFFAATS